MSEVHEDGSTARLYSTYLYDSYLVCVMAHCPNMLRRLIPFLILVVAFASNTLPAPNECKKKWITSPLTWFPRERVRINAGWRFHLGELKPPPPACPPGPSQVQFPTNLTGQKCLYAWCGACPGLLPLEEGYVSASACEQACCADSLCGTWQWSNESDGR